MHQDKPYKSSVKIRFLDVLELDRLQNAPDKAYKPSGKINLPERVLGRTDFNMHEDKAYKSSGKIHLPERESPPHVQKTWLAQQFPK
ncbi:unnamed protein product [Toxocara canis]|uniref:Chromosome partitioning protein ParB n=1 Tax=Toxocara canis TaxID=6265 RepID=A0A183UMC2_TOXCA|nr:unnamed protein product [Toxocara canis]